MKNKIPGKFTIGCCIANKSKTVSIALNSYTKTSPLTIQLYDNVLITTHAEIAALNKIIKMPNKDKLTLYTTGLSKADKPCFISSSKPCQSCSKVIEYLGINRVVYTTFDGDFHVNEFEND